MIDYIIIAILIGAVAGGIYSGRKHFRGEGGCCGGSTYKAKKKKLHHVTEQWVYQVEGMHCQHCVNRVMEAVNSIEGVSAEVHQKRGTVVVSMEHPVEEKRIRDAIEKAGYMVKDGKRKGKTS